MASGEERTGERGWVAAVLAHNVADGESRPRLKRWLPKQLCFAPVLATDCQGTAQLGV